MASDSATTGVRVLMAIRDRAARERLRDLLGKSDLSFELIDSSVDPLRDPPRTGADILLIRRSEVGAKDLRLVDAFTNVRANPGLVVLTDRGGDVARARLMAAGASSVLEEADSNHELRESLEAIADAERQGSPRGPHSGEEEPDPRLADFISRSPRMQRFLDLVHRVVDTDSSLLITGETGVGKERLAQAIHNEGARANGSFISVNCGAIPEQLLESEIFGHEAGAFTGAHRRKRGRFELADGGTIFLDEIGEMPLHLQVKLLTVLQRRRVQRVGSEDSVRVDVRVMAATNRDIADELRNGRFREDLYYRLNVVSLDIPPLRERREDVPDLAGRFISHFRDVLGRRRVDSISDQVLDALLAYDWPGNVRELVNVIEHAVVLCRGSQITLADLPDTLEGTVPSGLAPEPDATRATRRDAWTALPLREARRRVSQEFERDYLEALLAKTRGVIGATAEMAGITPRSLYGKMKAHGLRKEDYR